VPDGCATILALLTLLLGVPSPGAGAAPHQDWRDYVRAPHSRVVTPVAALDTAPGVRDADAALQPGRGAARLERGQDGDAPFLDLDFGQVVVGHLEIGFARASTPAPGVRVAFSESRRYLGPRSDFSRSDVAVRGVPGSGTNDLVPPAGGGAWVDRAGCQFAGGDHGQICADGIRAFRYVRISLGVAPGDESRAAPVGWAEIDYVRLNFTAFLGTPDTYRGRFLSSDEELNRLWYAAVYTNDLTHSIFDRDDVDPREGGAWSPGLQGRPVLLDGAKRDRAPWAGDLAVQAPTEFVSHADPAPVANVLIDLAAHQRADGYLPPSPFQGYGGLLFDYPAWWILALHEYALYTGDLALVARLWPALVRVLDGWVPSVTDGEGLLVKGVATGTADYGDYASPPREGVVTYYNALYARALQAGAALADAGGDAAVADGWRARADRLAAAIDARLWDPAVGAYLDATSGPLLHPQDGNAHAILAGVPRPGRADAALDYLATANRRPWGNAFVDGDGWFPGASGRVYPFVSYPEVLARFAVGRDAEALEQLRRTWGWMLDRDPGTTFWEAIGPDGDFASYGGAYASLAHGWSSGAAPALTNRLLGVAPTAPGFARYEFVPHPGDVAWAEGRVPTPGGAIDAAWERSADGGGFTLRIAAPAGTSGRISVPTFGRPIAVTLDGRAVWDGAAPAGGGAAYTDGHYVYLEDLPPGAHVIASVPASERREGRCFAATGFCVQGRFLAYWQANGGLARNGYPLTAERVEVLEDGRAYTVQYFERVRLEYHPENPFPYDVLLGQFGRRIRPPDPASTPIPGQVFFAATGHNLGGRFLEYWTANGGLAQFGFPLGEQRTEQLEDGNSYTVQYFERARLEYHPENPFPYDVLLGQFGRRILGEVDAKR